MKTEEKQNGNAGDVQMEKTHAKKPTSRRTVVITTSVLIFLCLILVVSALLTARSYNDRILQHVSVASMNIGGLKKAEASEAVQNELDRLTSSGLTVTLFGETATVDLSPVGATDPDLVYPLLDVDVNDLVEKAYNTGRNGSEFEKFFSPLWYTTFGRKNITADVNLAETRLSEAIRNAFPDAESPGSPTDFVIEKTGDSWNVAVTPAVTGATINLAAALDALKKDAEDLRVSPLKLELIERSAIINQEQAETLIPEVKKALSNAPYTLTFTDPTLKQVHNFPVTSKDLSDWLLPALDPHGKPYLTVETAKMGELLAKIHTDLDISPQDAVFAVEGDRVTDFAPSRDGVRVDDDALVASLEAAFLGDVTNIAISVEKTEAAITTEASNTFGIKELLGTGTSNFSGSPANRRSNIRHGVEKLNGILVAPGETLSLLDHLKPFTVADGYLPELVIKGDEIIPEVGGGLCQIGTTTFRAAMNSGLDIAERRNHSLVVSYYNDPSNNNPGTDATIYDPAPDLKINNDTGHYILLTTEMKTATNELFFRFWGTSDGREGSYTPPKVLSWTGYGAAVTKETDSLPPGVKNCQAPHPGATASFTYNVTKPDGEVVSREFVSTYRSLPSICLVGKSPDAPPVDTSPPPETPDAIPLE